jgi:hypothetical protein
MKSSLFANKSDAACGQNVGTKKLLKEGSIKNPNIINMLGFVMWWSRGDLNPRPPALHPRLYMFSSAY